MAPAEVASVKVDTRITDQVAVVRIEEEFYNPNDRICEGTFLFPVPKGAQLDRFTLAINGKPIEAELLAADKARGIYEDIVRRSLDPALLEYVGRDLFKVRVFPIDPHSKRQITVTYTQLLTEDSGMLNWILPLRQDTAAGKPIASLSVNVSLETKQGLKTVYSPSHKVDVARQDDHRAKVSFEGNSVSSEADFQLLFSRTRGELGIDVLMHRTGDEDGYFLLLATPQLESERGKQIAKDVVFVLDSSGSMAGQKLEQAKKALRFCIANLNEQDRFEILRFSTEVEGVFQKLSETGSSARERALAFVDRIKPTGGTAIHEALTQALALKPAEAKRPFVVVFLTDGRPTVGPSDENQISSVVTGKGNASPESLTRVFCFGIGTDVNTHLLDRISEATKAATTYVLPEEDLELKVSAFFTRIKEPALSNLAIEFPEGVKVSKLYPQALPDLFKGQQLLVAGRYSGRGTGPVRITGVLNGERSEYSRKLTFVESTPENAFLPRLWATRRIGYLLDEIRLRGENAELKDEVVELARKYAVVTPYTAYLVTEDEARRGLSSAQQTFQPAKDNVTQNQLRLSYRALMEDRSGDQAVAGARSFSALKSAEAPSVAIQSGLTESLRAVPLAASPAPAAASQPIPGQVLTPSSRPGLVLGRSAGREEAAQQARFVGGQSFFFNGEQWMDARVQSLKDPKVRRVEFASAEYFELLRRHPEAKEWFALGQSVQVVIDGQILDVRPASR